MTVGRGCNPSAPVSSGGSHPGARSHDQVDDLRLADVEPARFMGGVQSRCHETRRNENEHEPGQPEEAGHVQADTAR